MAVFTSVVLGSRNGLQLSGVLIPGCSLLRCGRSYLPVPSSGFRARLIQGSRFQFRPPFGFVVGPRAVGVGVGVGRGGGTSTWGRAPFRPSGETPPKPGVPFKRQPSCFRALHLFILATGSGKTRNACLKHFPDSGVWGGTIPAGAPVQSRSGVRGFRVSGFRGGGFQGLMGHGSWQGACQVDERARPVHQSRTFQG